MSSELQKFTFSKLDEAHKVCAEISIVDEMKERSLTKVHSNIKRHKAAGLSLEGYCEEIERFITLIDISEDKMRKLTQKVGDSALLYISCCAFKVMYNLGIINIRVEDN